MKYLGDFATGAVIYIPFATYDKDDGSSITMTGLAVTDIEIYKNGSVTQRASDAGYTLLDTDGIDFDGVTGIHGFSVDTSDNTDAGFYAAGSEYWVVVSAVTVDAVTVNFIAATFSIERSGAALALLKNATYGLSALETIVDDLEGRITATRAGYIDNLSAGAVALASGVTVTTNSDKTGYGLSQAFPTNFASLSITAGGLVDITQAAADKVWSTAARTLTSFGTLIADVWSYATRLLTAGTNIVLAKGTGVTGFNDLSAAQVNTEVDTAFTDNMGAAGAGLTALPAVTVGTNNDKTGYTLTADMRIKKNTALANFMFVMLNSTDHITPQTGLTITATRSLDGAAFAACANAVTELSNGVYRISLAAGDLNADVVTLRFTATGADDRLITIVTQTE